MNISQRVVPGLMAIFILAMVHFPSGPAAAQPSDMAVESLVQEYLAALRSGDLQTIKTLLSAEAVARREDTLNDPQYSGFLTRRYHDATATVLRQGMTESGVLFADIEIRLSPDEAVQERLLLEATEQGRLEVIDLVAVQGSE